MHIFSPLDLVFSIDDRLVIYLNSFAHRSWTMDFILLNISGPELFKGGVFMTAYWWAWFRAPENRVEWESRKPRETLLLTLLLCVPTVGFARLLALYLPFRQRPLFNPELHLKVAFMLDPASFEKWSSFPSDHGALFFLLATGFYLLSRRLGLFLYIYTFVLLLLPRVYWGVHYPSDILVGMLLGLAIGFSTLRNDTLRRFVYTPAQRLLERSPGLFYAILFQISFQTIVYYQPLRKFDSLCGKASITALRKVHRQTSGLTCTAPGNGR
jgi:membrane-associated phospholipid phosphatase